ncbi:hypothetical protein [Saliterribacillus persicus]|uniref:Uncharacterized protein n=1 Tax=Saliterribacillus persicus TaxID=930114 RepID=A0A368XRF2_9BACI|nr:hypothetical protein [Saliterribacillus persicus]RCW70620.1 hypothetical protein DFR57_10617 [Saliterribacillus persicus]
MTNLITLKDGNWADEDIYNRSTPSKRTPYNKSLGRTIKANEFNRPLVDFLVIEIERCGFVTIKVADDDYNKPLSVRTDRANKAEADAYVSIHFILSMVRLRVLILQVLACMSIQSI